MTKVRVFVPSTTSQLVSLLQAGGLGPAPFSAHTAAAQHLPDADLEELEYDAMTAASLDSLRLIGPDDRPCRVVIAVDAVISQEGPEQTAVVVTEAVPLAAVAAVHVDGPDAAEAVAAAVASPDDDGLIDEVLEHELAWYAVQEIPDLLG